MSRVCLHATTFLIFVDTVDLKNRSIGPFTGRMPWNEFSIFALKTNFHIISHS